MITQRGFTVLEIMVALALIAIAIVSLIELSSANLRNLAKADDQIEAASCADAKMREILDMELPEDKTWIETDEQGFTHEITVTQKMKEKTDFLKVNWFEITLTTGWMKDGRKRQNVLKTAALVSKKDSLKTSAAVQ